MKGFPRLGPCTVKPMISKQTALPVLSRSWSNLLYSETFTHTRSSETVKISASMSSTHKHLVNCVRPIKAPFILTSFNFLFLNTFLTLVIVFYLCQSYANSSNAFSKRAFLPNFDSELLNSTGTEKAIKFSFVFFCFNDPTPDYSTPST